MASNEKNLEDSKNNAHGCDRACAALHLARFARGVCSSTRAAVPEAEKKLASSKDLLLAHTETAQRKLKTAAYWYAGAPFPRIPQPPAAFGELG